ncbi:hypothetical protein B4117_2169 [Bacillus mycoides]|nr:hypothetical protein B4117_2169 [Bacillus mycoides]
MNKRDDHIEKRDSILKYAPSEKKVKIKEQLAKANCSAQGMGRKSLATVKMDYGYSPAYL